MLKKLNWKGVTHEPREVVLEKIKGAISSADAYIINFQMYSDLDLSLAIEVKEHCIKNLYDALNKHIFLSDFGKEEVNDFSKKEWMIFLNISFSSGKGNLKIQVPQVPG